MTARPLFVIFGLFLSLSSSAYALPKYAATTYPLSKRSNDEYFKKNAAPDFWRLMPYYNGQMLGQQCTATTLTMALNAARSSLDLTSDDKLLTLSSFIDQYTPEAYAKMMKVKGGKAFFMGKGFDRKQVANTNIANVLNHAIDKLKIRAEGTKVEFHPIDLSDEKKIQAAREEFHQALVENEKSGDDFLLLTAFMQGTLTGDPEGGPHAAPVGAYDEKTKQVLIMDPDREWYEPYWAPEELVFKSIADKRADHSQPGWIRYKAR